MKKYLKSLFLAFVAVISFSFCLTACNSGTGSGSQSQSESQSESSSETSEFTVTFDGNGGTLISGIEIQTVKSSKDIVEPTYEKSGFDFDGWDKTISDIKSTTTVNAQWKEKPDSGTGISISGFTQENNVLKSKVNNNIESYSFINKVTVSDGSSWKLYSDISGTNEIVTKTISLEIGDNTNYILVTSSKGELGFYTVIVRRLPIYTVSFNTNGGSQIDNQLIQEESLIEPVDNPTKQGYDFVSWDYDFTTPVMSDLVINAQWEGHQHTVSLDVNGGDPLDTTVLQVKYGDYVSLPNPTRTGYSFSGWYNGTYRVSSGNWKIDSDVTLVANWTGNNYRITYNPNGGRVQISEYWYSESSYDDTVVFGSNYTVKNAIKTGYELIGWFDGETKLESGVWSIPNNVSVTASWTASKYTITYDVNGGDPLDSNTQDVYYDSAYTLKTPNRDGYKFLGWYNNDQKFESGTWTLTNDVSLKAKWEVITYSVTLSNPSTVTHYYVSFDKNDGTGVYETVEASVDQPIAIPSNPLSAGKKFRGWFTDSECNNYFDFSSSINESITLYAGWYDCSSAVGTSLNLNSSYQSITVQGGYKTGYYYAYVYIPKTQKYNIYFDEYSDSSICTIDVSISSLFGGGVYKTATVGYVNYQKTTEQCIEIDGKGGDLIKISFYESYYYKKSSSQGPYSFTTKVKVLCDELPTSSLTLSRDAQAIPVDITYGANYDLGVINYTGFTFYGWYTEPNGQGTKLTGIDGKSIAPWQFTDVTKVYAYITTDSFTITYNPDGGTIDSTTQEVLYNEQYLLKTPTKTGYTFVGWFNGDTKIESGVWHFTENLTLKAKWQVNSYSVTLSEISTANHYYLCLDKNDGTGVYSSVEVYRNASISYPTPCTRSGYIFTGWFAESSCTNEYDFSQNINCDTTIYAGWRKVSFSNPNYNLILNGDSLSAKYTNGGTNTIFYITALSTGTYNLNYSCTANAYLYFYDLDDGQSSHSYMASLNGSGSYSLSVTKGHTYNISFGRTQSSYQTGTTCTAGITGTYPDVQTKVGTNPDLTLNFNYDSSYSLGIPDSIEGKTFVGWFTEKNGCGEKLTDSSGNSISNWHFTSSINAYAYFIDIK